MHPFEKESTGLPPGVSPHLDVRLKPGWRFDRRRRALVAEDGRSLSLRGLLAPKARVVPMAPALAAAPRRNHSEDEDLLARYLQVVVPADADPADLAAALRRLDGVEVVTTPPPIGLP